MSRLVFVLCFLQCALALQGPASDRKPLVQYCEQYRDVDPSVNGTKECENGVNACFVLWTTKKLPDNSTQVTVVRKGCFMVSFDRTEQNHPCGRDCIQTPDSDNYEFCCCNRNSCNRNFTMVDYPEITKSPIYDIGNAVPRKSNIVIISSIVIGILTCLSIVVVLIYLKCKKRSSKSLHEYGKAEVEDQEPRKCTVDFSQLKLIRKIGQGRYGTVWKSSLHDKTVAVKVFSPENMSFWQTELYFYRSLEFNTSPYILKFVGACEQPMESFSNFLLLTEYHPQGSLYDYLHHNIVNWKGMCLLSQTMASGLTYLHQEQKESRPAFAHRDFNSKNILVKQDGTCALADFGFTMKVPNAQNPADDGTPISEVGTLRYMAPEVLDGAVNLRDIQGALKQIDIYAMALVLWEIAMRCEDIFGKDQVPDYKLPFEAELGPMITSEAMHSFVVIEKARPGFPDAWNKNNPGIRALKDAIEESWDQDPDARLLALCVEGRIMELYTQCPGTSPDNLCNENLDFQQNLVDSHEVHQLLDKNLMFVTMVKDKETCDVTVV